MRHLGRVDDEAEAAIDTAQEALPGGRGLGGERRGELGDQRLPRHGLPLPRGPLRPTDGAAEIAPELLFHGGQRPEAARRPPAALITGLPATRHLRRHPRTDPPPPTPRAPL